MRGLYKEPLVHFLTGALAIFLFFSLTGTGTAPQTINLTASQIERLQANWLASWRRPASEAELAVLIQSRIDEELLYQEALNLDLDIGDTVVRNRMIQKMRFLHDESIPEPSEADLKQLLVNNITKYQAEDRLSFEQIFLGENIDNIDLDKLLKQLNSGSAKSHADLKLRPLLNLPQVWREIAPTEIARRFGTNFAQKVVDINAGIWIAGLQSGYGFHAVRVSNTYRSPPPSLTNKSIRQRIENDWRSEQRELNRRQKLTELREQYRINVDTIDGINR